MPIIKCIRYIHHMKIPNHVLADFGQNRCEHSSRHCDGATYWATGVKDRSITQPRLSLTTFPPPWNSGSFGTHKLTYGRTCLPNLLPKSWGPRETCIIRRTRKYWLSTKMFEVGFELLSWRRRQIWRCYLLSYRGKRLIDYPAQHKPYNTKTKSIKSSH